MSDFAPFAPSTLETRLPRQTSTGTRKATGHLFMDCPAAETVLLDSRKRAITCEICRDTYRRVADAARAHQAAFDASWKGAPLPVAIPITDVDGHQTYRGASARPAATATEKQVAFLLKLWDERTPAAKKVPGAREAAQARAAAMTKAEASAAIDRILATPKPRMAAPAPAPTAPTATPEVAAGHYAVASATGNNDLDFYRVDRPSAGTYAGRVFVKRIIGGSPDQNVRGTEAKSALARIAADPQAAARYGQEIGRCCRCNRHLTDEASRAAGIGPECSKK